MVVVATTRERTVPARGEALAAVVREAEHLPLARLGRDDVRRWLEENEPALIGDVDALVDVCEGNPLFLREVVAATRERGVAAMRALHGIGVRGAIEAHLGLVSAATRDVLAVASVLGRDVASNVLAALAGDVERNVDEAVDAALLVRTGSPGVLRFAHVLVREAAYGMLSAARRADLHRRAARSSTPTDWTRAPSLTTRSPALPTPPQAATTRRSRASTCGAR